MLKYLSCLVLVVAACASQPDARECATGIICPEGTKCAAVEQVCITNDCGDGIVQATEKCDDGNIEDGDGCAANCLSRETCGDGVINAAAGELCDDGNTQGGDGCSADCRSLEQCGNGVRDVNEVCDDGNTVPGDGCSGNCKSTEICGNNIVDINEKCDDGGAPGGCNDDCQGGTGCGDGAIDKDGSGNPLEECDDGNTENQDDCSNTCHLNHCGDGIKQISGTHIEECDPAVNFGETIDCNIDCTSASCGDGKINKALGEECDNGMANGDDRDCTSACKVNVCGDGKWNQLGPSNIEGCDDGDTDQLNGCSNECTVPTCGNGVREMSEACDDGNTANGDGCSHDCAFESCGDGIVNNGEACDPGPAYDTTTCNSDCTAVTASTHCGDFKINVALGEECDDGNNADNDFCRANTCKKNICGDGNKSPTEGCDDGNLVNTDACSNSCKTPTCGDGILNGTDQCDDGNTSDNDGCLTTCVFNTCGDAKVWTGVEECDNGTANNGPTRNCTAVCKNNVCGDGFRDQEGTATEACDDGNKVTEANCPYGVATCQLCNATCTGTLNLSGNVCGDGNSAAPETCDDGNAITDPSCAYSLTGNGMCNVCNNTCTATVAKTGPYCGDGTTQSTFGESCDDRNQNACGTCDASCNNATGAAKKATGLIVTPGSNPYNDNDTFVITDGFGTSVTFEFDTANDDVAMGHVKVTASPNTLTPTQMRDNIESAINGSGLLIVASDAGSSGVLLTHKRLSRLGNQDIIENVNTSSFYVSGMGGGVAGDCDTGIGCKFDDDCKSHNCQANNTCQ